MKQLTKDASIARKKDEINLEKENMDEQMLAYEGMMLAKKCYNGKYIEKVNITNMSAANESTQVMTRMLQKFGIAKEIIGQ